jgi:hypothetical protein
MSDLLAAAKKAPRAGRAERTTDMWMPAVIELRRKNYSYADIYEWLRGQGEDVHPNLTTFTSVVSRRLKRWQQRQMQGARK